MDGDYSEHDSGAGMSPRGRYWANETTPRRRYYRRHRAPRTPSLSSHLGAVLFLLLLSLVLLIAGYSLLAGLLAAVGGVWCGSWLGSSEDDS